MKLKNRELLMIADSLNRLITKDYPVTLSFKLSKLTRLVNQELEDYNKSFQSLWEKYGQPIEKNGENTGEKEIKPENRKAYTDELEKLLEQVATISFQPIPLKDFGDTTIQTRDLMNLEKVVQSDEAEENPKAKEEAKTKK